MANPNVEKFSREVIDTYQDKSRHLTIETARATAVAHHAAVASEQGQFAIGNAAKLARASVDAYREKVADGMTRTDAAKEAAKEMGERFNRSGRDTHRQHDRSISL